MRWGGCNWDWRGQANGNIGFVVSIGSGAEYIRFQYTYIDRQTHTKTELDYRTRLAPTSCYFGGQRWWFLCPMSKDGVVCNRRVGILYLGDGKYFGCRHCYNLTYLSCKENHKFDNMFSSIGLHPEAGKRLLQLFKCNNELK
jgi:hypothetical protein